MFDIDLTPAGSTGLAIVAAAMLTACVVSFVLDSRAAAREYARARAAPRLAPQPARAVDEADEARAYEWLTSGSGQYRPMPRPNSDSRA